MFISCDSDAGGHRLALSGVHPCAHAERAVCLLLLFLSTQKPPEQGRGPGGAGLRLLTTSSSRCMWWGWRVASSSSLCSGCGRRASPTQPLERLHPMAGSPGCNRQGPGLQTWGARAVTGPLEGEGSGLSPLSLEDPRPPRPLLPVST